MNYLRANPVIWYIYTKFLVFLHSPPFPPPSTSLFPSHGGLLHLLACSSLCFSLSFFTPAVAPPCSIGAPKSVASCPVARCLALPPHYCVAVALLCYCAVVLLRRANTLLPKRRAPVSCLRCPAVPLSSLDAMLHCPAVSRRRCATRVLPSAVSRSRALSSDSLG